MLGLWPDANPAQECAGFFIAAQELNLSLVPSVPTLSPPVQLQHAAHRLRIHNLPIVLCVVAGYYCCTCHGYLLWGWSEGKKPAFRRAGFFSPVGKFCRALIAWFIAAKNDNKPFKYRWLT